MNKQVDLTGAAWHKSSFSNPDNCVEVARVQSHYAVRDSKNPQAAALVFTPSEWSAFVKGVNGGEFS
ncbi:MAG: DUF397 domain-containing protein [Streptosporangiales bacterium]|nr:DUF397 domain-containing protein [Streptosporangiales bacterium]